jgi:hypothetical protein
MVHKVLEEKWPMYYGGKPFIREEHEHKAKLNTYGIVCLALAASCTTSVPTHGIRPILSGSTIVTDVLVDKIAAL